MNKKLLAMLIALSMTLTAFTACSNEDADSSDDADTTVEETEATEEEAEETAEEETDEEEVEEDAQDAEADDSDFTYVSLSPEVTEIIFALGAEANLVGVSAYDDYPADVFDYPVVGDLYTPDVEAIAETGCDVVIASAMLTEDAIAALDEYGINVMVVTEGTTLDGMFDLIADVASIVDAEDAGEALIAETQEALDAIEVVETDATVYYVVDFGEYGDFTAGGDTFINDMIVAAGATNAAADVEGWYIDLEALIAADPDVILVADWAYDSFITTAPYSDLTAVAEGRVYPVDANLFSRQGPRNVEGIQIIVDAVAEFAVDAEAAA